MKKVSFMLLVGAFSLLAFSPPTLAHPDPTKEALKEQIRAIKALIQQTHDHDLRQQLHDQIKDIRASIHA